MSPCLLSFWLFGYVRSLFVLDAPRAGRASDGGVLHRSIGIEPPRLPCGRAANYGSIIVPNTCHRLHREQPGFYRVSCIARSDEVVAHSRKRLRGSAHSVGNVPDAWIFSFQGSLSGKALRKQICLASCGENPLTIRWVMLSDFWTFLFSLSPFNGHFSARCQVSHQIYFCCGSERNNGGVSRNSRVWGRHSPTRFRWDRMSGQRIMAPR